MSSVVYIAYETFAKLVGKDPFGGYLFMVSDAIAEKNKTWSKPVQFRFVHEGGVLIQMEIREVSADMTLRDLVEAGAYPPIESRSKDGAT